MEDKIKCPKCSSTQLHADKRGFSTGKAVIGTVAGGVLAGAAMGGAGSNKIQITCLNCGHVFSPGRGKQIPQQAVQMSENQKTANVIFFIVATIVSLSVLFTKGILWTLLVLLIAIVVYGIMSAAFKKDV